MSLYRPDCEFDDLIVEVKHNLSAFRSLRAAILNLAFLLPLASSRQACLLLIEPGLSTDSLKQEWSNLSAVLSSEIFAKLSIASYRNGQFDVLLGRDLDQHLSRLLHIVSQEAASTQDSIRLHEPDYAGEILRLMIFLWLQTANQPSDVLTSDTLPYASDKQPLKDAKGFSLSFLEKTLGASYRTVIRALDSLRPALTQYSDRSVALTAFPKMAWEKFIVMADSSRSTKYYTDRSGQPRTPNSLLQRLKALHSSDIAIGGVEGAVRIYPELDLVGSPRLDLHIHAASPRTDLSFIRKLDPALQEISSGEEKPSLAIHFLRRKYSYFRVDADLRLWADPIECLLDLLTMRMDNQALQFRNAILPKEADKWLK